MITLKLNKCDSNEIIKNCNKIAKIACKKENILFINSEILVKHWENGRCYIKNKGSNNFVAHG